MNNRFHPISEVFPLMSEAEFAELRSDIALNGLRDDITLFEGQILDGRNRWRACQDAGVEPRYEEFSGPGSPVDFVASKNLHRRNLTDNQRAMAAAKLANLRGGRPRAETPPIGGVYSQAEAAEKFKVSERSVSRAKKVLDDGVPELVDRVEDGSISLSAAEQIAGKPKTTQVRIMQRGRDKIVSLATRLKAESTLKNARTTHDCCLLCNADIHEVSEGTFIAFLESLTTALKRKRGGGQFARYMTGVIEEIQEGEAAEEYHDVEQRIFSLISQGPHEEKDLMRLARIGRDLLEYTLGILANYGWIEQLQQGGKTEVARGRRKMVWSLTAKGETEADRLVHIHNLDRPVLSAPAMFAS